MHWGFVACCPRRARALVYQGCMTSGHACPRISTSKTSAIPWNTIASGLPCMTPLQLHRMVTSLLRLCMMSISLWWSQVNVKLLPLSQQWQMVYSMGLKNIKYYSSWYTRTYTARWICKGLSERTLPNAFSHWLSLMDGQMGQCTILSRKGRVQSHVTMTICCMAQMIQWYQRSDQQGQIARGASVQSSEWEVATTSC